MAAVLFDLDGTLTDPVEGITKSICYALERMGKMPPESSSLSWAIGPPLIGSLTKILGTGDSEEASRCLELYRERFSVKGLFENNVYDGVPEMLTALQGAGHRLFVATSKPKIYAERIIEHFGLSRFFDGIYGSELDGLRSDKADLIKHVLTQESLRPRQAIMVGDREHDVIGAKRNGVECIGALWGYGGKAELMSAGASTLCPKPSELASYVAAKAPFLSPHLGA